MAILRSDVGTNPGVILSIACIIYIVVSHFIGNLYSKLGALVTEECAFNMFKSKCVHVRVNSFALI